MKKEIPMLFSTPMVQANHARIKTETRRLIGIDDSEELRLSPFYKSGWETIHGYEVKHRYGSPGDWLWQRETFFHGHFSEDNIICDEQPCEHWDYLYYADTRDKRPGGVSESWCYNEYGPNTECYPRWHPSLHMPKVAARTWMENVSVHPERLGAITDDGAIAEGIKSQMLYIPNGGTQYWHYLKHKWGPSPIHSYQTLWESINGVGSWNPNKWVWVIKYKVLSTTGKPAHL